MAGARASEDADVLRAGVARRGGIDRFVGGRPPRSATLLLLLLLGAEAVLAQVPAAVPAAAALGAALAVLAALWTPGRAAYGWVVAGGLVLTSWPVSASGAGVSAAVAAVLVVLACLIRTLVDLFSQAQSAALRHYGERDAVVRESRAQRKQLTVEVQYWASHDRLCEVLNRSALAQHLKDMAAARTPTGVLVISAAGFAVVNDELGTEVGDELLTALAQRLRTRARDSDLIARLGGDEFAVVLSGVTDEHAGAVAERLLRVLADPFVIGPHLVPLRARCGLAVDNGSFVGGSAELLRQASSAAGRRRSVEASRCSRPLRARTPTTR